MCPRLGCRIQRKASLFIVALLPCVCRRPPKTIRLLMLHGGCIHSRMEIEGFECVYLKASNGCTRLPFYNKWI